MSQPQRQLVDLSILTIIKFFLVLIFLAFIYFTRQIWLIFFVALILAAAISPAVDRLMEWKIPRSVSVVVFFFIIIAFIGLVLSLLIPPLIEQVSQFSANLPAYSEKFSQLFTKLQSYYLSFGEGSSFTEVIEAFKQSVTPPAGSIFDKIFSFFGGVVAFIVMLVIAFYLAVEQDGLTRLTKFIVPESYQFFFIKVIQKIQGQIVNWLKGQLILSFLIGLMVYISLLILGVDYALILALVAFLGEFIPYLGPVLAAIPAVFLAFVASPILGIFVLILFIVIQQAENHILVPKIMQRAVGLNPVISIIALLIGAKLAGLVGVILAIPVTTALMVVIKEFYSTKNEVV